MPKQDTSLTQLNDIQYYYTVLLLNDEGLSVQLTQDCVKLLVINDNIFTPFNNGYMVIDNPLYALQRGYNDGTDDQDPLFDFNMGDTDYVYIEITPLFKDNQAKGSINDDVWTIRHLFVIDGIEDLKESAPDKGSKKLYLIDPDMDKLDSKSSNFSTAKFVTSDIPKYQRDDDDRSVKTGTCIQSIISEAIPSSEFSDIWDDGSNSVFYTSPTNASYLEDLMYFMKIHQGSVNNDFCMFSKERFSQKWKSEKFSQIVEKALDQVSKTKSGDYQLEAFTIAESGDTKKVPLAERVPNDYGAEKNIFFSDISKIESYELVEISNISADDYITTSIAHSYDHNDGKFIIEHYDINDIKSFFDENYSSKLQYKNKQSNSIFKIDKTQEDNLSVDHTYSNITSNDNSLEFCSRNRVLKSTFITNIGIQFTAVGFTHRQSGKFFSVQKQNRYVPSEFESKLQGQWLCTGVEHVFSRNTYTNNIVGVKLNKTS